MPTDSPFVLKLNDSIELRLHTINDADREWEMLSMNMEFLGRWVDWAQPTYVAGDVRRDMAGNLPKFESGEMYAMGIYVDGELAGNVDIRDIVQDKTAEVGYLLAKNFVGKGLVTKSLRALMEYVQKQHGVKTFFLNTYADNIASKKVAERLGFTLINEDLAENGRLESHFVKQVSPSN